MIIITIIVGRARRRRAVVKRFRAVVKRDISELLLCSLQKFFSGKGKTAVLLEKTAVFHDSLEHVEKGLEREKQPFSLVSRFEKGKDVF